jgi:signal transduction histidine kinase
MSQHEAKGRLAGPDPSEAERMRRQHRTLVEQAGTAILDVVPGLVVILNANRRIVYANRSMIDFLGLPDVSSAIGKRPGEALNCIHSHLEPEGCGSSVFCSQCGAVRSILVGLSGRHSVQECRILREVGERLEALDLQASSTPLSVAGDSFVVFSLADTSHEKRRRALEQAFFHDILNTAGGLKGLLGTMLGSLQEFAEDDANLVHSSFSLLIDEILAHKDLLAAENGELAVNPTYILASEALDTLLSLYENHPSAQGRSLCIGRCDELTILSDFVLIRRTLGNLAKNALEASGQDDIVTLSAVDAGDAVEFIVHNPGVMAPEVQLQMFKRSFSTKGHGRGLGAYSVKILVERYLGGAVSFLSSPEEGTSFRIRLPLRIEPDRAELKADGPEHRDPVTDGAGVVGCGQSG